MINAAASDNAAAYAQMKNVTAIEDEIARRLIDMLPELVSAEEKRMQRELVAQAAQIKELQAQLAGGQAGGALEAAQRERAALAAELAEAGKKLEASQRKAHQLGEELASAEAQLEYFSATEQGGGKGWREEAARVAGDNARLLCLLLRTSEYSHLVTQANMEGSHYVSLGEAAVQVKRWVALRCFDCG